jgi:hypothetical protein
MLPWELLSFAQVKRFKITKGPDLEESLDFLLIRWIFSLNDL